MLEAEPGPPVVLISTVREAASAFGLPGQEELAMGGGAAGCAPPGAASASIIGAAAGPVGSSVAATAKLLGRGPGRRVRVAVESQESCVIH
jgi:hypothetical protein